VEENAQVAITKPDTFAAAPQLPGAAIELETAEGVDHSAG
jgi:hypothetical protein